VVIVSFSLGKQYDFTVLTATLVGVTALIFTAKGNVRGQVLIIIFSILYAIVSYRQAYYGEMISYVFMSGGIAAMSVVAWIKHPYSDGTVKVGHPSKKAFVCVGLLALLVTVAFYFILKVLGTASLFFSTLSISTSFVASALTLLRSPYYAAAYALNDVVLIVLWIIASISDTSAIPMTVCFIVFLINDIYGFVSWLRMEKAQRQARNHSMSPYF
jgi:nicotinamide mononucleotide transporter PnuC